MKPAPGLSPTKSSNRSLKTTSRQIAVESLESRELLAYGDSVLDLYNIDSAPPHAPFTFLLDSEPNNTNSQANPLGLNSLTGNAVIMEGDLFSQQTKDIFKFNAGKGDMIAIFATAERNLPISINGTSLTGDLLNRGDIFSVVYTYRAPSDGEHFLAVGPSLLGYYGFGIAIAKNEPVVASISGPLFASVGTAISLSDRSYDPEENAVLKIDEVTGLGNGIVQRSWSGGDGRGGYTFSEPGIYPVTLTVTSNDGETAIASRNIVVSGSNLPTGKLSSLQFVEGATMASGGAIPVLPDPGVVDRLFDDDSKLADYLDSNADGASDEEQPVLYVAGSVPKVLASFTMPSGASGTYYVRGIATDPSNPSSKWHFEGSAGVGIGRLDVTAAATTGFGVTVAKYDKMVIQWEMKSATGGWTPAGNSRNTVYVSAAVPVTTNLFQTVVDLAVRPNHGTFVLDTSKLLLNTWSEFKDVDGLTDVKRIDGLPLMYWGATDVDIVSTSGLLATGDGKCGAWARFLIDTLAVNGIVSDLRLVEPINKAEAMLINNWTFDTDRAITNARYPYVNGVFRDFLTFSESSVSTASEVTGNAGQNQPNPESWFDDHALVLVNGVYYDPSYGRAFSSLAEWEEASVAGYSLTFTDLFVTERRMRVDLNNDGYLNRSFIPGKDAFYARINVEGMLEVEDRSEAYLRPLIPNVFGFNANLERTIKTRGNSTDQGKQVTRASVEQTVAGGFATLIARKVSDKVAYEGRGEHRTEVVSRLQFKKKEVNPSAGNKKSTDVEAPVSAVKKSARGEQLGSLSNRQQALDVGILSQRSAAIDIVFSQLSETSL